MIIIILLNNIYMLKIKIATSSSYWNKNDPSQGDHQKLKFQSRDYNGVVQCVTMYKVNVWFPNGFPYQRGDRFQIQIHKKYMSTPWDRMLNALGLMARPENFKYRKVHENIDKYILGDYKNNRIQNPIQNVSRIDGLRLNNEQRRAVELSISNHVSLIQGPPGTGKTTTATAIIKTLIDHNLSVLVCTPSNTACDHLAEIVHQLKIGQNNIRIYSKTIQKSSSKLLPYSLKSELERIKQNVYNKGWDSSSFINNHKQDRECSNSDPYFRPDFEDPDFERDRKEREQVKNIEQKRFRSQPKNDQQYCQYIIQRAKVVFTTCTTCGDFRLKYESFDAVIIDEASQAIEPELLIAIQHAKKYLILLGDHKQIRPIVINEKAASLEIVCIFCVRNFFFILDLW